jgi:hypothetical protein
MNTYQPQWDEHDRPRVACPHRKGVAIASKTCYACEHLEARHDYKNVEQIECAFPDVGAKRFVRHRNGEATITTPAQS